MTEATTIRSLEELLLGGLDRSAREILALEELAGAACTTGSGLVLYGHLCLLSSRVALALRCYRGILETEPGSPGALLGRLVALDLLGARTTDDTRAAEALFRSADETDRWLLAPLASAPLRRAAWISVGTPLADSLARRVAGQEEGRGRLVEFVTGRIDGGPGGKAPVVALSGPEGTGKRTAVLALSRALFRQERVLTLHADDLEAAGGVEVPSFVLVDGLANARPEELRLTARAVQKLAGDERVVLVALRVQENGPRRRRPVGFPAAVSREETLAGRLGTVLAAVVDSEIRFPALDEQTSRLADRLTWRERTWPIAVERGGWANVEEPGLEMRAPLRGAA